MRSVICLAVMLFSAVVLSAVVHYVPEDYSTIQAALNSSVPNDTIRVSDGVYYENLIWPQVDGIVMIGESMVATIVDGSALGRVLAFAGDWSNPVITSATKVYNFTFRRGNVSGNGVGVFCNYASPEFYDCIISANVVPDWGMGAGGGVYCYASNAHFTNVYIVRNVAYSGGGVHIDPLSSPTFTNCVIADNILMSPGGSYAAGIYMRYQVYPYFDSCTIARNRYYANAAIHLGEVSAPVFVNCVVTDNEVGFRFVSDATATVSQSTIAGNNEYAVTNVGTGLPSMMDNYWGSSSGPQHTTNPTGTGDLIEGSANFTPWLSVPAAATPPLPPTGLTVQVEGTTVQLNWNDPNAGIDYYVVNFGTDPQLPILPENRTANVNSLSIQGLAPDMDYYFQVRAVYPGGITGWYSERMQITTGGTPADDPCLMAPPQLVGIYPNPFSDNATIKYSLTSPGDLSLKVYNVKGQLVRELISAERSSGEHDASWDGKDTCGKRVANGVYLLELRQGNQRTISKLLISK